MSPLSHFLQGIEYIPPGTQDYRVQRLRESFLVRETAILDHASKLHDDYSQEAAYVCVMSSGGECDALARVIHRSTKGFELERYLDPANYAPVSDRTLELSEVIINKRLRGGDPAYKLALGFGRYLSSLRPDTVIGLATEDTLSLYERLGCQVHRDVIAASYWGVDTFFCSAHPADRIPKKIIKETPPAFRAAVRAYFDVHESSPSSVGSKSIVGP